MSLSGFVNKWLGCEAGERATAQPFLCDLVRELGGADPHSEVGVAEHERSYFEYPAKFAHPGGTVGKIDFFKPTSFVLEAKQGVARGAGGIGERESPRWHNAMHDARGQALGYAETLETRPPFLIVCDVGYCFDLYASFDGSGFYRPFPDGRSFRHYLERFGDHVDLFRQIWHTPGGLDPSRQTFEITRDAAARIAELVRELRTDGRWSGERVARFLIRAIFTMFAQDARLLPAGLLTRELERWTQAPGSLPYGLAALWRVMREGGVYGDGHHLRRFGGWLFDDLQTLPLEKGQVELLRDAARHDWAEVEPAIFGTLLEGALDRETRHARGAHFTPRGYVERLVRPTVEDPLRRQWELVRGQVRDEIARDRHGAARRRLLAFHRRLTDLHVLDPACGSGNFLYVAFDAVKRLEVDVLSRLAEIEGKAQDRLELPGVMVTPEQFLGLEVDPWAGYLAELVLWIGYLQWQIRTLGGATAVQEPVLGLARSVVRKDALLDGPELDADTYEGRLQVRRALWPAADFIVGNPPFLGNKRMRGALGDSYVDALRRVYPEIPASADLCMFWWHRAAERLRQPRDEGGAERFGFITTNSITQPFNRRVVEQVLADDDPPLKLQFAIPDHPWVADDDGAAVRIAMTVVARADATTTEPPLLARLTDPNAVQPPDPAADPSVWELVEGHPIHADLTVGPDLTSVKPLAANAGLCAQGVKLVGDFDGAGLDREIVNPATGAPVVRPLLSGRVLVQESPDRWHERLVIDFAGLTEDEAAAVHPQAFERLLRRVKPLRDDNRRRSIRELWWRFGWERPVLRDALAGLERYIVTASVAKHRLFVFLPTAVLPDGSLFAIASDDPFVVGVLNSRAHRVWALAAGGRLGDANTPTWSRGDCFEPFPFPRADAPLRGAIGERALAVESHRQARLREEPGLHLTGLYNRLAGGDEPLLARLHERLDERVLDAYGLAAGLDDVDLLERLVEIQRTQAAAEGTQGNLLVIFPVREPSTSPELAPWPRELPDRLAVVWQLLERLGGAGLTLEEVAKSFHGAQRKTVGKLLESLVGLGLAVRVERSSGDVAWLARRRLAV